MSASGDTTPDFVLPALDVRALARRAAVPGALAAVAAAAIIIAGGPLQAFADALGRALDADPRWVAGAAAFLGAIALAGGAIALGFVSADGPLALSAAPAAAAALAIAGGLVLAARSRTLAPDAPASAAPGSRLARIRAAIGDTPAALGTA